MDTLLGRNTTLPQAPIVNGVQMNTVSTMGDYNGNGIPDYLEITN
jgi:hypothetical protein